MDTGLKNYFGNNLRHDLFAGLTVAIVSLPLALAFGVASGMGPQAGLYGAIITGMLAAIFGGTPLQVTGPTAPATVLVATLVAGHGAPFALAVIALAGLFQVVFGLVKLGKLIEFLPYPVVSGFMTGVAILIIKSQADVLFQGGVPTLVIVLLTIAIVHFAPKLNKTIPSQLLALVAVSLLAAALHLDLAVIGTIPYSLPIPALPFLRLQELVQIVFPALSLALLASIDSLLTSVISDTVTGKQHKSDRELIGQGIGNMASGLFGGIAGAGATVRTLVNIRIGARTRLSGVFCSIFILIIMLFLGNLAAYIPLAVLAGILIHTAIKIVDYDGLKSIAIAPAADSFVMLATIAITVVQDLVVAVGAGIALSSFLFLKMLSEIEVAELSLAEHAPPEEREELGRYTGRIAIYQINGPLFFGTVARFTRSIEMSNTYKAVILKMFAVTAIDQTGIRALSATIKRLKKEGITLIVTNLQKKSEISLQRYGLIDEIGKENIFTNPRKAIEQAKRIADGTI